MGRAGGGPAGRRRARRRRRRPRPPAPPPPPPREGRPLGGEGPGAWAPQQGGAGEAVGEPGREPWHGRGRRDAPRRAAHGRGAAASHTPPAHSIPPAPYCRGDALPWPPRNYFAALVHTTQTTWDRSPALHRHSASPRNHEMLAFLKPNPKPYAAKMNLPQYLTRVRRLAEFQEKLTTHPLSHPRSMLTPHPLRPS